MLTLFLGLIATLSVSVPAWAERPLSPRDGYLTIGSEASYFNSSANYRTDGTSKSLFPGASFENAQIQLNAAFDLLKSIRVFSMLSYGMTNATDGVVSRNNSDFNEFGLGAQYWFRPGPFYIVPQLSFSYPISPVVEASNNSLLNDGSMRFEAGGYGIWRLAYFQPFAYGGYAYRDAGRSDLLTYSIGAYGRMSFVWAQAEYRGYTSMNHDSDSNNRGVRDIFLTRVDGGSYRFYGIDPTLNEAAVSGGFYLGSGWKIYAGYALTVNGNDTANGWTATAGLSYGLQVLDAHHASSEGDSEQPAKEPEFRPESDKYDDSLFTEKKDRTIRRKIRKTPSVDKLLNDTEKELNSEDNKEP